MALRCLLILKHTHTQQKIVDFTQGKKKVRKLVALGKVRMLQIMLQFKLKILKILTYFKNE